MSDISFPYAPNYGGPVLKFKDQGDGTMALPVAVVSGGGGGGGAGYSISDIILQDSTGAQGIRRETVSPAGTVTFLYENFDGTAWTPTPPMVAVAIAPGAGSATAAKQDTGNTSLASLDTKTPTVGQKNKAGSSPVVIASDQDAIPVTQPVNLSASGNITVANSNLTTGTATAGSTVAFPSAMSGMSSVIFQTSNVSGWIAGNLSAQISTDGVTWATVAFYPLAASSSGGVQANVITGNTIGAFIVPIGGAPYFRVTAVTTVTGTAGIVMTASAASPSTVVAASANILSVGGVQAAVVSSVGGNSAAALVVGLASSSSQTAYSAVSVVTSAKTGLATVTEAGSTGSVCSFYVNLSAFTAGSSAGLDLFLQWSPDGATNWFDLYQVEAFTAAGTAFIPAIYIPGRWRFAYQNRGGAATLATLTVTATRLHIAPPTVVRQFFDRTAGVLAGTTGTFTAWYDVSGCNNVAAYIPLGVATGAATYQLQFSADGVNALPGSPAVQAAASTTTAYTNSAGATARFARLAVTTAATSQTASTAPIVITGC